MALTIGAGLVLLFVVGIIFAVSRSTSAIISEADALHDADEALRAVTVVRAQLELASLQSQISGAGSDQEREAILSGLDEATEALAFAGDGLAGVIESDAASDSLLLTFTNFQREASRAIGELSEGRPAEMDRVRAQFEAASTVLTDDRDELAAAVSQSDRWLANVASLAGFLVAFAIPAAILLLYRELSKRHDRQRELQVHLDAEREINSGRESFIATASHELRSPLTGIRGIAHLLAEEPSVRGTASAREMVTLMIGEAEDLTRLVEDLLTASRIEAGAIHYSFEDVDVANEVATLRNAYEVADIHLGVDLEPAAVRADRLRLRQMIRNLISNAVKYGGSNVWLEGEAHGETYVLKVCDDGDGVPPLVQERLFERFVHRGRETAGRQSVGLGLSIVMALAVGMGGNVFYERTEGVTSFAIALPLVTTDVLPRPRTEATRLAS